MRILHTADWHFGKTIEGRNRSDEQNAFVDELVELCEREMVDLILVAGDVYQTVNPSAEAEALLYRALNALSANGTRGIVVIAGNHDNAERINAARPLADRLGITLMGLPKDELVAWPVPSSAAPSAFLPAAPERVQRVNGGAGYVELSLPGCSYNVVVAAIPYPSEGRLNEVLSTTLDDREQQRQYSRRVGEWVQSLAAHFRTDTVNLVLSHLYVQGGQESDSEVQIQIGGVYAVDPGVFPSMAQYVALGHLHRPQNVKGAAVPIRYAGSPLAYSFSEAGQVKSVTLIDATPGQPVSIREVPLTSGQPLVEWEAKGGIPEVEQWVAEGRDANAWIDLRVHVQTGLDLEHIHHLRNLHPGFVHIHPVFPVAETQSEANAELSRGNFSVEEVFRRFFAERTKTTADDELVELFLSLVAEADSDSIPQADEVEA